MEIGGDDRGDAHQFQPGDDAEADRPAAQHQRRVGLVGPPAPGMLEPHRQRLDQRGMVVGHAVRNFVDHGLVEQHQFAEAAGAIVAVSDHLMRAVLHASPAPR